MQVPEHQPYRHDSATDTTLFRITALAVVTAAFATLATVVLLNLIRFFTDLFFFQTPSLADRSSATSTFDARMIAVPLIGGLIVDLMARFGSEKIHGHGIPEAIEATLFGESKMSPKVAVLKPLLSGIVTGGGGPFGARSPIIMTGGAIGSLFAQFFKLTAAERKTLLVAGATAGMTAVLGMPVAALLFAVELLLLEWRPHSMLPVTVACAVAGSLRVLVLKSGPLLPLDTIPATLPALGSCVVARLLCDALACSPSMALYKTEGLFGRLPVHWIWWLALGGLVVGIGGYFEPRALGVGYDVIGDLLYNHLVIRVALALLVIRAITWVIALDSGMSGGVLVLLLMMGVGLGVLIDPMLPGGDLGLWPFVCVAVMLAGVLGAPLTAVVFAFDFIHDVSALLSILLTVVVSYGFVALTMPRSIITEEITHHGFHIYRGYVVDPLERHAVEEVMTCSVQTIDAQATLADMLVDRFGATQTHRVFLAVQGGPNGTLIGMLDHDALLADQKRGAVTAAELFDANALMMALPGETRRIVATCLVVHGLERLSVVADSQSCASVGAVSRSDLIKLSLASFDEEQHRERFRRAPLSGTHTYLELHRRRAGRVVR